MSSSDLIFYIQYLLVFTVVFIAVAGGFLFRKKIKEKFVSFKIKHTNSVSFFDLKTTKVYENKTQKILDFIVGLGIAVTATSVLGIYVPIVYMTIIYIILWAYLSIKRSYIAKGMLSVLILVPLLLGSMLSYFY